MFVGDMVCIKKISTHTLTWSVTGGEIQLRDQDGNFNSHAHVERDLRQQAQALRYQISTHTLTWSVTYKMIKQSPLLSISTHTLTWSVTNKG